MQKKSSSHVTDKSMSVLGFKQNWMQEPDFPFSLFPHLLALIPACTTFVSPAVAELSQCPCRGRQQVALGSKPSSHVISQLTMPGRVFIGLDGFISPS